MPRTKRAAPPTTTGTTTESNAAEKVRTRVTTPAVQGAIVFNKLSDIEAAEKAELAAASPEAIVARYKAKRDAVLEGVTPDIMVFVNKLMRAD